MFELLGKIPKEKFSLACSGGKDSMVFLSFLKMFPKNKFNILYFNHGTPHGQDAENFLVEYCGRSGLELVVGRIFRERTKQESPEEYWRNQRYSFFDSVDNKIITCHHLNDCVETWIFSSLRGQSKLIPYTRNNIFRPFLKVSKSDIEDWCIRKGVEWIEDPSNSSSDYTRNLIRNDMMEMVLRVNPGIEKTIKRKIIESWRTHEV